MKKIYQRPEMEVIGALYSKYILGEGQSGEVDGKDFDSNVSKTFDEGELSTDTNKSGLWDD